MGRRDPLVTYRDKRTAGQTPEPEVFTTRAKAADASTLVAFPAAGPRPAGLFVIHKHSASRLHWDLRLELGGVLKSWAVPKGPSLDPTEKRLAVHVEDHPLEYVDFEDVIPEGNYGAGPMIIWDRGTWVALEDPVQGLDAGKLLFELRGHKLRGVWTLVKLKKTEKEWLLIRERKHMTRTELRAAPEADARTPQESVLSGLTVEELGTGTDRGPELRRSLESLGAPKRSVRADQIKFMLAHRADGPFSDPEWLFELKLDGYRMLGVKSASSVRLLTRGGNDATRSFPELVRALKALPVEDLIIDGEVVMHDETGLPRFQRLQKRARLGRPMDIKRASLRLPATFYAFDVLALLSHDVRPLPLLQRKELLRRVLPSVGPIRYVDHFLEVGEAMFDQVTALRLEGVVGKKTESRYRGGRSRSWLKIRADRTADLIVVGYTAPKGSRDGFGALHLAAFDDDELVYVGRVGTGFDREGLREIRNRLDALAPTRLPLSGPAPKGREHRWVEPRLVCEVRYLEWTADHLLRQPVFLRLREDKPLVECTLPESAARTGEVTEEGPKFEPDATPTALDRVGWFSAAPDPSNPDKVFWPEPGYTKRDLYEYYRAISRWVLPYLEDRPLVLTRYPDGIDGKFFYQKNVPVSTPEWIRTEKVPSERSEKEIEYFVCDDEASLLYLANLGTIPLHVWASRIGSLDRPDWCILDLDPKGAPFANVVHIARVLHQVCDTIDLPNFVKTSGSSGLHVLIPLGGVFTYEQSRTLGELLARVALNQVPEMATITRSVQAREGKVYIDYLQNRRGQLLVAPFSVRPVAQASVSTPLRWREVSPRLDIHRHTIGTVPRRVARMRNDPMRPLLGLQPDLPAILTRLTGYLGGTGSGGQR
jgi:bifunctional non-homologous end joining protein LigD